MAKNLKSASKSGPPVTLTRIAAKAEAKHAGRSGKSDKGRATVQKKQSHHIQTSAVEQSVAAAAPEEPFQAAPPLGTTSQVPKVAVFLSITCLMGGLVFWILSLPNVDPQGLTDYGIVAILPWQFWVAVATISLGFALSLQQRLSASLLPYLHLLALVVMLHATPALAYGTLRYSWAWKHIGIVDFIQRHGKVDPLAPFLAAYHNWPGLFYVSAAVANALDLALAEIAQLVRFTPPVLTLLFALALIPIYRRLTDDPRLVAAAIWIFITGNWIGQDYFSPQGVAFLAYLLIIGICIGPIRKPDAANAAAGGRLSRFIAWARALSQRTNEHPARHYTPPARAGFIALVLVLILATTATHQLTPISIILVLAGLAVMGRVSIYYCIFAIVAEILWILYFAAPFMAFHLADELNNVGEGINAAQQKLVDISVVSPGRVWVIVIGRVLTAAIAVLALIGGLRRLILGFRDGLAVMLTVAAFPLFVNRYGGEILFRVYLFSLPMLGFFAAAAFFPSRNHGRHAAWRMLFLPVSAFAVVGFLYANNGKDRQYYFTRDEVEASLWLYGNAPPDSLLIEGSRNYPSQLMNYENFAYVPMSEEERTVREEIIAAPEEVFARWLSDPRWKAGYIIITSSQKAYSDAEGVMPSGALDAIEARLLRSPRFKLVYATPNAKIFSLHQKAGALGPWTATTLTGGLGK
jgi:hypothetical protein